MTVASPTPPTSSSGSPLGNNRKGTIPSLQTLQIRAAFPSQSSLSLHRFPHSRLQAAAAEPRGQWVSWWGPTSERPLLAGLWLEGFCHRGPSHTSGGHCPSAGLPRLNPLCLHKRYPGENCPSPSMFCFGFLQLSKYFSYLFECIHVELHAVKETHPPL